MKYIYFEVFLLVKCIWQYLVKVIWQFFVSNALTWPLQSLSPLLRHHCGSVETLSSGIVDRSLYYGDSMFWHHLDIGLIIPNGPLSVNGLPVKVYQVKQNILRQFWLTTYLSHKYSCSMTITCISSISTLRLLLSNNTLVIQQKPRVSLHLKCIVKIWGYVTRETFENMA